ncbi:asparaginase [soil metagenome]
MGHILLLDAGGTISSRPGDDGALTAGLAADRLIGIVPQDVREVRVRQVYSGLSEEMTFSDMARIVEAVALAQADPEVSGIVVAHGTDIMEETAFLTDLMVARGKPVIFTGAQRAANQAGFDGPSNLRDAVVAAGSASMAQAGVAIAFAGRLVPARQAAKVHTSDVRAFRARDGGEGRVRGRAVTAPPIWPPAKILPRLTPVDGVEMIGLCAGSSGSLIRAAAGLPLRGLVLCALGRGNAGAAVLDAVKVAIDAGLVVVVASRCQGGASAPDYATGMALERAGAIFSGALGASQARILLAALLAEHRSGPASAAAFRRWIYQPPGM